MESELRAELVGLDAIIHENLRHHAQLAAEVIRRRNEHFHLIDRKSRLLEEIHRLERYLQNIIVHLSKKELNCCQDACGICLTRHKKRTTVTLSCGHSFGRKCIQCWFNKKRKNECPFCKAKAVTMTSYDAITI